MSYYGVNNYPSPYSSNKENLKGITQLYLGSEVKDGFEVNGIFDEIELFFEDKSTTDITTMLNNASPSMWTVTHQLLAHLDNSLDGGNLFAEGISVTNWRIYKKKSNDAQYELILTIPNDETLGFGEFVDGELANNINYDYAIEGISSDNIIADKYEILNVSVNFKGVWLTDIETGDSFQFKYNIPELTINSEFDRSEIKTLGKRPLIVRGQYKAKKGSLQADLVQNNNNANIVLEQFKVLENMEGSNNLILKFDNGDIFKVDIYNLSYTRNSEIGDVNKYMPIKCDYVQIGDVSTTAKSNYNNVNQTSLTIDGGVF